MERKDDEYQESVPSYARGLHILVVDEDTASLRSIASILEQTSYKVTAIQFPDMAVTMIQEKLQHFDLILLSTKLQNVDCITYLKHILAINEDMPIVLMSPQPDLDVTVKALQHGAMQVLEMPIARRDLINIWQHVFHKRAITAKKAAIIEEKKDHEDKQENMRVYRRRGKQVPAGKKQDGFINDGNGKGKEVIMEGRENQIKIEMNQQREKRVVERKRKARNEQAGVWNMVEKQKQAIWNAEFHKKIVAARNYAEVNGAQTMGQLNSGHHVTTVSHLQNHNSIFQQPSNIFQATATGNTGILQARIMQIRNAYNAQKNHNDMTPKFNTVSQDVGASPKQQLEDGFTFDELFLEHQHGDSDGNVPACSKGPTGGSSM